jgi:hypothetical protein
MKNLIAFLISALLFATNAKAEIGSADTDLVFTPVTPCRIFDTRYSSILAANSTRNFIVSTRVFPAFAAQGGASTDCNMTANANTAAIAVNLTVVTPATAGYITAFPVGAAQPLAATVNYGAGDVRGNFAIVKVNQSSTYSTDLAIYSTSTTHVIGDIVGYYSKPVATPLQCIVTGNNQSSSIPVGLTGFALAPACSAGYAATATFCDVSTIDMIPFIVPTGCVAKNNTASAQAVFASQRCCQIPGR